MSMFAKLSSATCLIVSRCADTKHCVQIMRSHCDLLPCIGGEAAGGSQDEAGPGAEEEAGL